MTSGDCASSAARSRARRQRHERHDETRRARSEIADRLSTAVSRLGSAIVAVCSHAATCLAVARPSATQSGMPTPRKPLPVTNSPGWRASAPIDRRHPREVADFVLRVGALPAVDAREQRLAGDAEQRRQRARSIAPRARRPSVRAPADRARRRRTCASARGPPARGAATSTTATSRRGCRSFRRAARRSRIRSADARSRRAETRARRSPADAYGISPQQRASSASRSRSSALVAYAGVASTTARAVDRLAGGRFARVNGPSPAIDDDGGARCGRCVAPSARTSARTISLRPPGSDLKRAVAGLRAVVAAARPAACETRAAGCRASARPRRSAETARAPTGDRRRRRGCRPAAARRGRSSPPRRIAAS